MAKNAAATEKTIQELENLSADKAVDPTILRRGIVRKHPDGAYYSWEDDECLMKIDEPDANTTYVGRADFGTATSASKWQIMKVSESGNITTVAYADGNKDYDNVWDNRASLSYS